MSDPLGEREVPLKIVLEEWDRIARRWRLTPKEHTSLLGGSPGGDIAQPPSYGADAAERRMRLLLELDCALRRVVRPDARIRTWLRRQNQHLGGATPMAAMASSPEWVRWLTKAIEVAS